MLTGTCTLRWPLQIPGYAITPDHTAGSGQRSDRKKHSCSKLYLVLPMRTGHYRTREANATLLKADEILRVPRETQTIAGYFASSVSLIYLVSMSLINTAYRFYNRTLLKELDRAFADPFPFQESIFRHLIARGKYTVFGAEHRLEEVRTLRDFQQRVPIRDYNALEPYIQKMLRGQNNVLCDKPTTWFALSSGTSSARSKFIPMNMENLKECHYKSMLTMLSHYVRTYPQSRLFRGKSLVLGGSRQFDKDVETQCSYGDLSAFLTLNTPAPARLFTTPPRRIGLIPDFETKTEIVSRMAVRQNVVSFSGVPSWNLLLMRKILNLSAKKICQNCGQIWNCSARRRKF